MSASTLVQFPFFGSRFLVHFTNEQNSPPKLVRHVIDERLLKSNELKKKGII